MFHLRPLVAFGVKRAIVEANTPAPTPVRSLHDCLLVISLAASIHGTDKAVRLAAYRMLKVCRVSDQLALAMIVSSTRPLKMIGLIYEELPSEPKRKRGGKNWNRAAKRARAD